MKTTRKLFVMAVASLLGSGCIIQHQDDGTGSSFYDTADLDFTWSCSGARCADTGVMTAVVTLDGPEYVKLETPIGSDGVSLQDHSLGTYGYHIVGLSPSRMVLFEAFGTVNARRGINSYDITLLPPGTNATLDFTWDCGGAVCADVGVASTVVELTGAASASNETQANGMSIDDLPVGTINFHIVGLSPSRVVLYESYGTVNAVQGDNYLDVRLDRL